VIFVNVGSGNVHFLQENTSATSTDRWMLDANTGYRTLWSGSTVQGMGLAVYDATGPNGRWRFSELTGYNTAGALYVRGNLFAGNGVLREAAAYPRLQLSSSTAGNNGSSIRWYNSAGSSLFTMGPDYNGNATADWWMYDNTNGINNVYINNTGTSYLSFGTSYGGIQYAESSDELALYAAGATRLRLTSGALKISTHPYYQKRASGTTNTSISCEGTGEAMGTNAMDARGWFTTGTGGSGQYDCTMTFGVPWDLSVNVGVPVCTATTSSPSVSVAVTAIDDHTVTFSLPSPANVTVYYHCDGLLAAP
jgi:hypothetical protein